MKRTVEITMFYEQTGGYVGGLLDMSDLGADVEAGAVGQVWDVVAWSAWPATELAPPPGSTTWRPSLYTAGPDPEHFVSGVGYAGTPIAASFAAPHTYIGAPCRVTLAAAGIYFMPGGDVNGDTWGCRVTLTRVEDAAQFSQTA